MAVPVDYVLYAADPSAFAARIDLPPEATPTVGQPVLSAPLSKFWVHNGTPAVPGVRVTTLYNTGGIAVDELTADGQGFVMFWAPPGLGTLSVQSVAPDETPSGIFRAVWPAKIADDVETIFANFGAMVRAELGTAIVWGTNLDFVIDPDTGVITVDVDPTGLGGGGGGGLDPYEIWPVPAGGGFVSGVDNTAAATTMRDALVASAVSDGDSWNVMKRAVVPPGVWKVTAQSALMDSPATGTSKMLRNLHYRGYGHRSSKWLFSTGMGATADPAVGNMFALWNRARGLIIEHQGFQSDNANQSWMHAWCSSANDGTIVPSRGSGAQNFFTFRHLAWMGTWDHLVAVDGDSHHNQNSEVLLDRCFMTNDAAFTKGAFLSGFPTPTNTALVALELGSGLPTSGTWTARYNGQTTGPLAFNASAATVQAALLALSSVGAGNMVVTGSAARYRVVGAGALAAADLSALFSVQNVDLGGAGSTVTHYRDWPQIDQCLNWASRGCVFEYKSGDLFVIRKGGWHSHDGAGGSWIGGIGTAAGGVFFRMPKVSHFFNVMHMDVTRMRFELRNTAFGIVSSYWGGSSRREVYRHISVANDSIASGSRADHTIMTFGGAGGGDITVEDAELCGNILFDFDSQAAADLTTFKLSRAGFREYTALGAIENVLGNALRSTNGFYPKIIIDTVRGLDDGRLPAAAGATLAISDRDSALATSVAAMADSQTTRADVFYSGDSLVAGSISPAVDGATTTARGRREVDILQESLRAAFPVHDPATGALLPGGPTYIAGHSTANPALTNEPVRTGGATTDDNYGLGARLNNMAVGEVDNYALLPHATHYRIHYARSGGTGNWRHRVDAGAWTTVASNSGAGITSNWQTAWFPIAATGAAHTVDVESQTLAGYVMGVEVAYGDKDIGTHVLDAGHHGFKMSNLFGDRPHTTKQLANYPGLCLAIIDAIINDARLATDPAVYSAATTAAIAQIRSDSGKATLPVLLKLRSEPQGVPSTFGGFEAYVNVLKAIAAADAKVGFWDGRSHYPDAKALTDPAGVWGSDRIHMGVPGQLRSGLIIADGVLGRIS